MIAACKPEPQKILIFFLLPNSANHKNRLWIVKKNSARNILTGVLLTKLRLFQILTEDLYFRMKKIFYIAHLAECPLSEVPSEQVRPNKLKVPFNFFASLFQDPMYRFSRRTLCATSSTAECGCVNVRETIL